MFEHLGDVISLIGLGLLVVACTVVSVFELVEEF